MTTSARRRNPASPSGKGRNPLALWQASPAFAEGRGLEHVSRVVSCPEAPDQGCRGLFLTWAPSCQIETPAWKGLGVSGLYLPGTWKARPCPGSRPEARPAWRVCNLHRPEATSSSLIARAPVLCQVPTGTVPNAHAGDAFAAPFPADVSVESCACCRISMFGWALHPYFET